MPESKVHGIIYNLLLYIRLPTTVEHYSYSAAITKGGLMHSGEQIGFCMFDQENAGHTTFIQKQLHK